MNSAAAEIIISGVVQGVGFRYFCLRTAQSLNLFGWVKNSSDGSVISYTEGDRSTIEEYIKQLKIGPSYASVADIKVNWKKITGKYHKFDITF